MNGPEIEYFEVSYKKNVSTIFFRNAKYVMVDLLKNTNSNVKNIKIIVNCAKHCENDSLE